MVVVAATTSPILLLAMQDYIAYNGALIRASASTACVAQVHDRAWECCFRGLVVSDLTEVTLQLPGIVVPGSCQMKNGCSP
jgi:hypothetical protein